MTVIQKNYLNLYFCSGIIYCSQGLTVKITRKDKYRLEIDTLNHNLRERLLYHLHLKGLSYKDVDHAQIRGQCNCSGRYLRQLVMGAQSPSIRKLADISEYFDTTVLELLLPLGESVYENKNEEQADVANLKNLYSRSSPIGKTTIIAMAEYTARHRESVTI